MTSYNNPFRLNVGFIIAETNGYSRDFPFSIDQIKLDDLELRDVYGNALITRSVEGLLTQVRLHATVQAVCTRCLEPFTQPLHPDFTEIYAYNRTTAGDSDLIIPDNTQIDLAPLVREYMLLDVPISPLCRPDCKGLCPHCGENLNLHPDHQHEDAQIDPRLEVLRKLIDSGDSEKS